MKSGKTLVELAQEITRQNEAKKDFIAPVASMAVKLVDAKPVLQLGDLAPMPIGDIAHSQLAEYTGIPLTYYKRMLAEAPELLATSANRWMQDSADEKRMIRTLDGRARAVLSNKYRPLDNADLAEAILPVLMEQGMIIMSAEITERRLYIKAVDRRIERDIPTGRKIGDGSHVFFDTLSPAVTIANSEVGYGALSIEQSVFTKVCTNLATIGTSLRKYHTGARAALSDDVYELLSNQTRTMTDAATFGKVRDVLMSIFDQTKFRALTDKLQAAGEDQFEAEKAVALIEGGDLSRYGVHSAITRHSADVLDYDRATELERLGGAIIELPRNQWQEMLKAA